MNLPSDSTDFLMVSRYATCGAPTFASTPNSRFMRSTMISGCSSPMPEMMVCPDSSSVRTRKDGSSCASRCSATPIFSWSALVLGSTATWITGSGNTIFSRNDDLVRIAQGLTGRDVLQAHRCGDVAGAHFLDLVALVGMHLQEPPDALFPAAHRGVDGVARIQNARIDAEERELADIGIGHDLERERRERLFVAGLARLGLAVIVLALDRWNVHGRRQVIDHGIEHRLHALVLECGATQHRHDFVFDGADAQPLLDVVVREIVTLEVLVHELIVGLGGGLDHLLPPFLGLLEKIGGDVARFELHALGGIVPVDRLHAHEIDYTLEFFLSADRNLDGDRIALQARLDVP